MFQTGATKPLYMPQEVWGHAGSLKHSSRSQSWPLRDCTQLIMV